jgi:hypothetical protein
MAAQNRKSLGRTAEAELVEGGDVSVADFADRLAVRAFDGHCRRAARSVRSAGLVVAVWASAGGHLVERLDFGYQTDSVSVT